MLKRIRASRWLRTGLLVIVLGFCCYGLAVEWPAVQLAVSRLHWYSIGGAVIAGVAGSGCSMLAWRRLLADLGSKLPVSAAARVTFLAQLGKYVPGAIWSAAAQVELSHDFGVPWRRGVAALIGWIAGSIAVGLLIAAASLPLASPAVARKYLLVVVAIPVIAFCLAPPILNRLLNFALRIIRQEPLERRISWRGLSGALLWNTLSWLLLGTQLWLLLGDVAHRGVHDFLIALGAYSLACSLAMLLVVFPSGIGAREVILVAALVPTLSHGAALAVALAARLAMTVSDLTWGGIAVALSRSSRQSRSDAAMSAATTRSMQARRPVGRHRKTGAPVAAEDRTSPQVPEVAA